MQNIEVKPQGYLKNIMPNRKVTKPSKLDKFVVGTLETKLNSNWNEISQILVGISDVQKYYVTVQGAYDKAILQAMQAQLQEARLNWGRYHKGTLETSLWSNVQRSHIDHSRSLMTKYMDQLAETDKHAELRILLSEFQKKEPRSKPDTKKLIDKVVSQVYKRGRKTQEYESKIDETIELDDEYQLPANASHKLDRNKAEIGAINRLGDRKDLKLQIITDRHDVAKAVVQIKDQAVLLIPFFHSYNFPNTDPEPNEFLLSFGAQIYLISTMNLTDPYVFLEMLLKKINDLKLKTCYIIGKDRLRTAMLTRK